MSELTRDTLKDLERLCKISCTEDEEEQLLQDLDKILSYVKQLQELNTENVPPCNRILEENVKYSGMRDDEIGDVIPREVFMANAPDKIGGMIRVPPILKQR